MFAKYNFSNCQLPRLFLCLPPGNHLCLYKIVAFDSPNLINLFPANSLQTCYCFDINLRKQGVNREGTHVHTFGGDFGCKLVIAAQRLQ